MKKKSLEIMQAEVKQTFGSPKGIFVFDETGFIKKGKDSVGVQRQYTGTAGKRENCQIGTFLTYVSPKGHTFLNRRLYLPKVWSLDEDRRKKAHVPEEIEFQTKPHQALEMLQELKEQGFPGEWATGDTVYGEHVALRQGIMKMKLKFVLAVTIKTEVWLNKNKLSVQEIIKNLPTKQWKIIEVFKGSKGPRCYEWVALRVKLPEDPQQAVWLMARRSLSDGKLAYYLCHAPRGTHLKTLAKVAASRWSIEQCFEEAKGETGLDQYQVRTWEGWHRHTLLSMMAHVFLAQMKSRLNPSIEIEEQLTVPEIRRFLEFALFEKPTLEHFIHWSLYRRKSIYLAQLSHYQRRANQDAA